MPRILCDHNVPFLLTRVLPGQDITHASQLGWQELSNGKLLAAAQQSGFDILITADQSIRHQQNMTGVALALIVLDTNHWPTIRPHVDRVATAVMQVTPGSYLPIEFPRLRRSRHISGPDGREPSTGS